MKKGKHEREKFKIIETYLVLIFVATLIMCIGYAEISGINMNIEGEIDFQTQDGVFITNVVYISDNLADTTNSKINYYLGTVIDSEIRLGNVADSSITYQITVYNSTEVEQLFIGELSDISIPNSYTNENIELNLSGIEKNITTIPAKENLNFTITFKYKEEADITNNILQSKINFRFKENPVLILSNENQRYELNDIFPNYTSQEYEFTVSNYTDSLINNVPMQYYFETTIDKPLVAKIYNEGGEEVSGNISIAGDGKTLVINKYTLKIIWENDNPEENIDYNSDEYSNKDFSCYVQLKAMPDSEKYLEYEIFKKFDIDILTNQFYFETKVDNIFEDNIINVEFDNDKITPNLIIKNNDEINYNKDNIEYKIILENNDKFILYVDDIFTNNNEITNVLIGGEKTENLITLVPKQGETFQIEEQCSIRIESNSPYKKIVEYTINITRDLGIEPQITTAMLPVKYENGEWVLASQNVKGDWYDYAYQKWANVKTDNGYFVYIPRYAYKIMSGYHEGQDTAGTIAVVFLNEDNTPKTTKDSEGNIVNSNDIVEAEKVDSGEKNIGINATTKYIVHPAFTAFDTIEKNVDGLWVAKYEMSLETSSDGGVTWQHQSTESETVGNISIVSNTTKRMVSKPGVSSWRNINVTNIFENCYYMDRSLDSHMMKNTEWGAVSYLSMSKYGKGATVAIEANKSSSYITGCGSDGTESNGSASTTGTIYGIFDMSGGSYEYVAGYLEHYCTNSSGTMYSINQSLILSDSKYKDVYYLETQNSETDNAFSYNKLKVGDGLWEISDGTSNWFNNEFFYVGLSGGEHYPIFDRGGDYGSWSSKMGINYTGRNTGDVHPRVSFRAVLCIE